MTIFKVYTIRILTSNKSTIELGNEITAGINTAENACTSELSTIETREYKYLCYDLDVVKEKTYPSYPSSLNDTILVIYKLRKEKI